jgi:hypothetical protein
MVQEGMQAFSSAECQRKPSRIKHMPNQCHSQQQQQQQQQQQKHLQQAAWKRTPTSLFLVFLMNTILSAAPLLLLL